MKAWIPLVIAALFTTAPIAGATADDPELVDDRPRDWAEPGEYDDPSEEEEYINPRQAELDMLADEMPLSDAAKVALRAAGREMMAAPLPDGAGGVSFLYGAGGAVMLCAPWHFCEIALQPGETLLPGGIHLGDSTRWDFAPMIVANRQTILGVRPLDAGLITNMVIYTTKRSYRIQMESRREDYIPRISFRYPRNAPSGPRPPTLGAAPITADDAWPEYHARVAADTRDQEVANRLTGINDANDPTGPRISDLDYRYELDVCRRCSREEPASVFNDGRSTWVVLQPDYNGALPTFTSLDVGHKIIEQRWHDGLKLQIEGIFEKGVMRFGRRKEIEIEWLGANE